MPTNTHSEFWFWCSKIVDLFQFVLPFISLATAFIATKLTSKWFWSAFVCACLSVLFPLIQIFDWANINFVTIPHPQPSLGQNQIIFLIVMYGGQVAQGGFALSMLAGVLSLVLGKHR